MLRESSRDNDTLNLSAAVDPAADSGVPHGALLIAFAEAAVAQTESLPALRGAIEAQLGADALVDAAGVVANFQRMVRIADGCGIPLDDFTKQASDDWRAPLGLHDFLSAANTPAAAGTPS